jgi:hypothetical protein
MRLALSSSAQSRFSLVYDAIGSLRFSQIGDRVSLPGMGCHGWVDPWLLDPEQTSRATRCIVRPTEPRIPVTAGQLSRFSPLVEEATASSHQRASRLALRNRRYARLRHTQPSSVRAYRTGRSVARASRLPGDGLQTASFLTGPTRPN